MQCELCGRECDCRPASVDGVRMMLCPNCMKQHGKAIKEKVSKTPSRPALDRIKKPVYRDVYSQMKGDVDLVSNWNTLIRAARKKKGLSREELGFRIGERTVTIGKIENGDFRPSDKVIKKLEKELDVTLMSQIEEVSKPSTGGGSGRGLTLGDFIKEEE